MGSTGRLPAQHQPMPDYFVRDERLHSTACRAPVTDHVVCDAATLFDVPDKPVRVARGPARAARRLPRLALRGGGAGYLARARPVRDDADLRFVLFGTDSPSAGRRARGSATCSPRRASPASPIASSTGGVSVYRGGYGRHARTPHGATSSVISRGRASHPTRGRSAAGRAGGSPTRTGCPAPTWASGSTPRPGGGRSCPRRRSRAARPRGDRVLGLRLRRDCRRCLYDAEFADGVQQSQLEVVEATLDPAGTGIWSGYYERWLAAAGR